MATGTEIAVVGMAGRFPGADTLEQFWQNLRDGLHSITFFSLDQQLAEGADPAVLADPRFVPAKGALQGADRFDAAFFGFTPREAEMMDPQHRVFLECAWEGLESAGYDARTYGGRVGVYAGSGMNSYLLFQIRPTFAETMQGALALGTGSDKDFLATRVAYELDLKGPAVTVQTACSTSLVAVHMACQSLLNGECDMALAGGVTISVPLGMGYLYREGSIASPDGHCRAFDAEAKGTLGGSGAGVVVLKRLEDALADGDPIQAVIRGSAINNDGAAKIGYTAPSVEGQAAVIKEALALADVSPDTVTYVEAHGTGTPLGDPIEVAALTRAFREGTDRTGYCALGSVKTNIGHLDTAAGVAGLIKTVLALKHRELPPTLHFRTPNPACHFESSPFYVCNQLTPWRTDGAPRRAGVSSFGIGGTNAHVVLEEAPQPKEATRPEKGAPHLLLLSAKTEAALDAATANLGKWLTTRPEADLDDVAYTLAVGRRPMPHRRTILCRNREEAVAALTGSHPDRVLTARQEHQDRPVAFLFPGQGNQHINMARGLYEAEPRFREVFDRCAETLRPHLKNLDLRELLFGGKATPEELQQTWLAQPALFVVELALARLLMAWGIRPKALIGHSLGEYVAACLAGVLSEPDALALVALRGALMQSMPPGAMVAVPLSEAALQPLLERDPTLSLAGINAPALCVVSGPAAAIEHLQQQLAAQGIEARLLHTSHAFHSAMMDPVVGRFAAALQRVRLAPPTLPVVSNVTGTWLTAEQASNPAYWATHLRQAVRFSQGIETILAEPGVILLEVGPGQGLTALARQHRREATAIAAMRRPVDQQADAECLYGALGRLWLAGAAVDWQGVYAGQPRRRVALPTYPFQRQRYWVERRHGEEAALAIHSPEASVAAAATAAATAISSSRYARPALATPFAAPRSSLERRIAEVWSDLLGIEGVGIHDDFFELGGHSLMATQLVARLRELFPVQIGLRLPFDAPSVAKQAAIIREQQGPAPLSFSQQRLYFLEQLMPDTGAYNLPLAIRMAGTLDRKALEQSLAHIIQRHEALRTTFAFADGQPAQVVVADMAVPLTVTDLTDLPPAEREAEARRLATADAWQPFNLATGPLVRTSLLRLDDEEHVLVVTMHHLVTDGWSGQLFLQEFAACYTALAAGRAPDLPDLPMQYTDYALWQRQSLQGDALEQLKAYWRTQLAGNLPALDLPTDRPRGNVQTYAGADHRFEIEPGLAAAVRALAQETGTTLYMTLLAAWAAVLHRYTRQTDILIGSPVANRNRKELEGLIGFFVNTLVMRVDLSSRPTFRQLLARTRELVLDALAHQELPFELLVQELHPERDLSRTPIFQVMFNLQRLFGHGDGIADLNLQAFGLDATMANFDLTMELAERPDRVQGYLLYNTDLFDAATAARMTDHFLTFLAAVASQPDLPVAEAPLMTPAEQEAVLVTCNATAVPHPLDRCVHELIAQQAAIRPDAPAVIAGETTLTYRELDRQAEAVAQALRRAGARLGDVVALCLERSPHAAVALLGILKAGAAYLPLDPEYPQGRLARMLTASQAVAIVTTEALATVLPPFDGPLLRLDRIDLSAPPTGATPPTEGQDHPDNLAYVIYTSGSTGEPKGVAVTHRNLTNHALAMARHYELGPQDRVLQFAALSFDVAAEELYPTWVSGGAVVLPPARWLSPSELQRLIAEHTITVTNLPAAFWHEWVYELDRTDSAPPTCLRLAVTGSERVLPERYALWRKLAGQTAFVNAYGPTEATVTAAIFTPPAHAPAHDAELSTASPAELSTDPPTDLPIGRPIDNAQIYLLDECLQPVPPGIPGEIYIGGAGVARGYLGRPDLTAERFLPDPYATQPGARLYRTGDLGRRLPDGQILFLGRIDSQVKVRGFRIELGEIEAAIAACPGVKAVAVAALEQGAGERQLAAYFVPGGGEPVVPGPEELKAHLQQLLPAYMIPAAFIPLEALPLTPGGKIDLKALPRPTTSSTDRPALMPPRNQLEQSIAAIWQDVLQLARVGVHDNFFDLGGHSIRLIQVHERLQRSLGRDLPLMDLFRHPTIAGLAAHLTAGEAPSALADSIRDRANRSKQALQQWKRDRRDPGE